MGLFRSEIEIDPVLLRAMVGDDKASRKIIAREQSAILAAVRQDEPLRVVAADHGINPRGAAVVTDGRLFFIKNGKVTDDLRAAAISHTKLGQARPGSFLAMVHGPGVSQYNDFIVIELPSYEQANAFVCGVDNYVLPQARPRDIPTLYPTFFQNILTEVGLDDTPNNMVQLIDRVARMIGGAGATSYFDNAHDEEARQEFVQRFSNGGTEDRVLHLCDDMIDWLWEWSPACHAPLHSLVARAGDLLQGPSSFLRTCGPEIPPWDDDKQAGV